MIKWLLGKERRDLVPAQPAVTPAKAEGGEVVRLERLPDASLDVARMSEAELDARFEKLARQSRYGREFYAVRAERLRRHELAQVNHRRDVAKASAEAAMYERRAEGDLLGTQNLEQFTGRRHREGCVEE
jgi:hypothetical protein